MDADSTLSVKTMYEQVIYPACFKPRFPSLSTFFAPGFADIEKSTEIELKMTFVIDYSLQNCSKMEICKSASENMNFRVKKRYFAKKRQNHVKIWPKMYYRSPPLAKYILSTIIVLFYHFYDVLLIALCIH